MRATLAQSVSYNRTNVELKLDMAIAVAVGLVL